MAKADYEEKWDEDRIVVIENGQDYPLNRVVLEILSHLTKLEGKINSPEEEVAIHATAIQNAFFDNLKKLEDVYYRFSSCRRKIELKCHPEASAEWPTVQKRKKAPKKKQYKLVTADS